MLKEFIEAIAGMATKAQEAKILALPGNPRQYMIDQQGQTTLKDTPAPLRHYAAHDIDTFVAVLGREGSDSQQIWHTPTEVIGVIDADDRREFVEWELPFSPQFESLRSLPARWDQKKFLRFLRVDLAPLVDSTFIDLFRKLDFVQREAVRSRLGAQDQSLGRELEAGCTGEAALPDRLTITLAVYEDVRYPVKVTLDIEIDAQNAQFTVTALPGQIDEAIDATHAQLHDRLIDAVSEAGYEIPVFYGTPRICE